MDNDPPASAPRSLRKGRHHESGRLYLITAVTFQRHPFFADWRCAWAAAAYLSDPASWPQAELLCWTLMPDRWHGLLRLGDAADLHPLVRLAKAGAARATNRARGRAGLVWEPGFHERAVREQAHVVAAARYIVQHPVRAGLARRPAEYPYWDAMWLGRRAASPARQDFRPMDRGAGPAIIESFRRNRSTVP